MKRMVLPLLLLTGLLPQVSAEPPLIDAFRIDLTTAEVQTGKALQTRSIATQAYIHQLPAFLHLRQLSEFIEGRTYIAPKETPLGGWVLVRDLSTPKTTNTMPNVDTLYGAAYVWLEKQGPVVLRVPEIKDRYYSVAIHDAAFDGIDVIGTRTTEGKAGAYLIVPPGWQGGTPEGIERVITATTPVINLYQRIYLNAGDDIRKIRALQEEIRLEPLRPADPARPAFPAIDDRILRPTGLRETRDPLRFFEVTNEYTALMPHPPGEEALLALFAGVGLGPGATLPSDPAQRMAISEGAADAQRILDAEIGAGPFRNGWRVPRATNAKPGPHSLDRAVAQLVHIGVLPAEEALYYISYRDDRNAPLDGRKENRLTFGPGQLPPIDPRAFWSLTMYDAASRLVENPIGRYAIRPDTKGLATSPDGSLTLYLQHAKPATAPAGNWLPAPAGPFIVALRCYLPQAPAVDGTWFPPAIVSQP